jgi:hypothetical protein
MDKTATQNLSRTQGSDNPRLMWEYQRTLAREMDARFASHDFDLGRSQVPPFALLHMDTDLTYQLTTGVDDDRVLQWEEVVVDTTGMVDLSRSNKVVTLPETGYWQVGAYAFCLTVGNGNFFKITVDLAGTEVANIDKETTSFQDGVACHATALEQVSQFGRTAFASVDYEANGVGITSLVILEAWMWIIKVRDL